MNKKIFCTIGPASLNEWTIKRMADAGVSLFRINLSHTNYDDLEHVINKIKSSSDVSICIDTEGAQIRTNHINSDKEQLKQNEILKIASNKDMINEVDFCLTPNNITRQFEIGDLITIDFNSVVVQVIDKHNSQVTVKVLNPGNIKSNKAVNVNRKVQLKVLSDKDKKSIKLGLKLGIKHFALSFAHAASDVESLRDHLLNDSVLISKIECNQALNNLDDIIQVSDAILIDRGDLSREIPIEKIPLLQKHIIQKGKELSKKVYVATNLLESMIVNSQPTRAEVNDIYNSLLDGADALVLAAETAIGKFPLRSVDMIVKIIKEFEKEDSFANPKNSFENLSLFSSLTEPHGGTLVDQVLTPDQVKSFEGLDRLSVSNENLIDAEQIAIGTYSPIDGFMNSADLKSVIKSYKLCNGAIWTVPIVLQVEQNIAKKIKEGKKYLLTDSADEAYSIITVDEIYTQNINKLVCEFFGTDSVEHPGVRKMLSSGDYFVSGKIELIKKISSAYKEYELTPKELRFLFDLKGWRRVVGFHSRNVAHRGHEYIQKKALELTHADGLLISPLLGPKKSEDFKSEVILKAYELMINKGAYPIEKTLLAGLLTYPRYSGPREAIFTAICRKNMGCSHFIIGRDHAGVGDFYKSKKSQDLFKEVGDIGITLVFFDNIGFNKKTKQYENVSECKDIVPLSGTLVREAFQKQEYLPDWFIDKDVQNMLFNNFDNIDEIFY